MKSLPSVVIVGRTNVGKSTLFNRLSVDVKSLTLDLAGVTRDFLKDSICWQDRCFNLVDTGGISLRKSKDAIVNKIREKALELIEHADLILFVVDGKDGVMPEDTEIARVLQKTKNKILLVVNKTDAKVAQENVYEFQKLGIQDQCDISAEHGLNIDSLLDKVVQSLPKTAKHIEQESAYKVVLLGKPNVGKSSLLNLLVKTDRAIVADMPGTTREAISESVKFFQEDILLTDTPGVRRQRSVSEPIETLMVKSALHAVKDADIVLLLVDATEGKVADQELKLAFYAFEKQHKALILLFNKQDITTEGQKAEIEHHLEEYPHFTKKIASLSISCKTGQNIGKIMPLVQKVWSRHSQRLSDDELTLMFKESLRKKPMYHKKIVFKLHAVKQVASAPMTLLMIVNHPQWFGPTQLGFFENILRRNVDLVGAPIKFIVRGP